MFSRFLTERWKSLSDMCLQVSDALHTREQEQNL